MLHRGHIHVNAKDECDDTHPPLAILLSSNWYSTIYGIGARPTGGTFLAQTKPKILLVLYL